LPRPPAWIWLFTTTTGEPSSRAARSTSSGVVAAMPRSTGTPWLRKSCFPWYSWIFIEAPAARHLRPLP